ncbi:MAG: hypothetical protein QM638_14400 [Nocardioides sp.]|uniref:SPFH domain-containing protein n=1 Tax=Nocardioides sp. TaxID=35761 RepID=UPI0039E304E5
MSAVVVVGAVLLGLLFAASVRLAGPGERLVVLRRCRIRRVPLGRMVLVLPGIEETRRWPTEPVELLVGVRAETRDGADVRVLVTLVLDVDPPRPGTAYVAPVRALRAVVERKLIAAVRERDLDRLVDRDGGVRAVLDGSRLGGPAGGVVDRFVLDAVEVLLISASRPSRAAGPARAAGDETDAGSRR